VSARLQLPVAAVLEDLREVNVGDLDGRNDDRAWQAYEATLARWRSGELGQRFPGGESGDELAGRIGRALRLIARWAEPEDAIVVAHGASIRAAVPALTGGQIPAPISRRARERGSLSPLAPAQASMSPWPPGPDRTPAPSMTYPANARICRE
jgi:broad specificity phosphatase PhoE